ncbi:YwbE family protein [Carnobacterium divergens]|nr:YwbE family protein [Carnobacterium divergens]
MNRLEAQGEKMPSCKLWYTKLNSIKVGEKMNGKNRKDIQIGASVEIVLKKDQRTGKLTKGHVKRILTNSPTHPHGIKVMLVEEDQVGRVQKINPN